MLEPRMGVGRVWGDESVERRRRKGRGRRRRRVFDSVLPLKMRGAWWFWGVAEKSLLKGNRGFQLGLFLLDLVQ